jgi:glycosyltransferase involved in cell wall biosynthesis
MNKPVDDFGDRIGPPPRVLLVVSSYLPNLGGLQEITARLAGELRHRGADVSVLTHKYPQHLPANEFVRDIPVKRFMFVLPRPQHLLQRRLDLFLAGIIFLPVTLVRLLWLLARDRPNVVNVHFIGAPAFFVILARTVRRFSLVVSLHGDDVEGLSRGTAFDRWVFRKILQQADAVTANSHYLLAQAREHEPTINPKARVIHNGEDFAAPSSVSRCIKDEILAAGRMVPKKGFDVLLRALAGCINTWPCIHLTLVGDGPERSRIEALVDDLKLTGHVTITGRLDQALLFEAMAKSALIVIPSRQEPFGLIALEAMAIGKPVVATRVGGLTEVLEAADAILVPAEDTGAMGAAIGQMLTHLSQEPGFGLRNRDLASTFSLARMVDSFVSVYRDCSDQI